jgi:hypothetical protein
MIRSLFICLAMLWSAASAAALEAYVYDTVAAGTYAYDALSTGKLTLIKGSPFQTVGSLIGTNGKFLVTADSTTLFSYTVESNGAIGKLVSTINTQLYSRSECGTIGYADGPLVVGPGKFDHSGANIYVPLNGTFDEGTCDALQTYGISKTGFLTFKGSTDFDQDNFGITGGPSGITISGDGVFAYNFQQIEFDNVCGPFINTFAAEFGGVMTYQTQNEESPGPSPTLPPSVAPYGEWVLVNLMTDDPTGHVAMALFTTTDGDCEDGPTFGPIQLLSGTVNPQGVITTTNTYEDMPTLAGDGSLSSMVLDHTGKILAVATGNGVQFFHFDGGKPITPFTGVIGVSGYITEMSWDTDGHLYAQNGASGKMHVYDVTTKEAKELSGSPTKIPIGTAYGNPYSSFVVRSK